MDPLLLLLCLHKMEHISHASQIKTKKTKGMGWWVAPGVHVFLLIKKETTVPWTNETSWLRSWNVKSTFFNQVCFTIVKRFANSQQKGQITHNYVMSLWLMLALSNIKDTCYTWKPQNSCLLHFAWYFIAVCSMYRYYCTKLYLISQILWPCV